MPNNSMILNGKSSALPGGDFLTLNLEEDNLHVNGFGQPITPKLMKEMFKNYVLRYLKVTGLIKKIEDDQTGVFDAVKDEDGYNELKQLMDSDKHIISGVFGKETLLQILSQRECDGIRYIIGFFQGQITVTLMGVKENGQDGRIFLSEPLPSRDFFVTLDPARPHENEATDPYLFEVHKGGKTVQELIDELHIDTSNHQEVENIPFNIF